MVSKKLVGILIVLMVMLTNCATTRQIEVSAKPIDRQIIQPALPREIDLKEPKWYVVSEKNIDEFLERLKKEEGQIVFFAMSVPDYELMAYNTQELKRFITELQQVIVYYREVTTTSAD